jgi:hypothetical protein
MNQPVDGGPEHQATVPASCKTSAPESPERAVQIVLAGMMSKPDRPLMVLIQEEFPERDKNFYAIVIRLARDLISGLIDGLQKSTDSSPVLLDRLSFTWRILRQADVLVWKLKKSDTPEHTTLFHAQSAFRDILPVTLQEPLLAALLEWLRLGSDGRYLFHYLFFRRAKTPTRLPAPFGRLGETKDAALLRTVIWWCLRARKEEYVEVSQHEPVRIELAFVVDAILTSLKGWCGDDIVRFPDITGEIERELNSWLKYSHLDLSLDDTDAGLDRELAKAFVKQNGLDIKLVIHRPHAATESDERVRQLQATIQQYMDEIRVLEERVRALEAEPLPRTPLPPQVEPDMAGFSELREVLKTIDAKYAFDTLNAVQLGEETHLTFRSFAMHLFYALRKRGLSEYPNEETFTLTYEASGLFDCDGFEVPPDSSIPVRVTRQGWALKARGRWLPVRRARVSPVAS